MSWAGRLGTCRRSIIIFPWLIVRHRFLHIWPTVKPGKSLPGALGGLPAMCQTWYVCSSAIQIRRDELLTRHLIYTDGFRFSHQLDHLLRLKRSQPYQRMIDARSYPKDETAASEIAILVAHMAAVGGKYPLSSQGWCGKHHGAERWIEAKLPL